jgi:hypothetical protein
MTENVTDFCDVLAQSQRKSESTKHGHWNYTRTRHQWQVGRVVGERVTVVTSGDGIVVEFPQSQARASEVIPTQVLQGTRKKRVR